MPRHKKRHPRRPLSPEVLCTPHHDPRVNAIREAMCDEQERLDAGGKITLPLAKRDPPAAKPKPKKPRSDWALALLLNTPELARSVALAREALLAAPDDELEERTLRLRLRVDELEHCPRRSGESFVRAAVAERRKGAKGGKAPATVLGALRRAALAYAADEASLVDLMNAARAFVQERNDVK